MTSLVWSLKERLSDDESGAEPLWGQEGSSPLPPGSPLEAKGMEEERGERRKKKREHEEGAPLVLRLAPSLRCLPERRTTRRRPSPPRRAFARRRGSRGGAPLRGRRRGQGHAAPRAGRPGPPPHAAHWPPLLLLGSTRAPEPSPPARAEPQPRAMPARLLRRPRLRPAAPAAAPRLVLLPPGDVRSRGRGPAVPPRCGPGRAMASAAACPRPVPTRGGRAGGRGGLARTGSRRDLCSTEREGGARGLRRAAVCGLPPRRRVKEPGGGGGGGARAEQQRSRGRTRRLPRSARRTEPACGRFAAAARGARRGSATLAHGWPRREQGPPSTPPRPPPPAAAARARGRSAALARRAATVAPPQVRYYPCSLLPGPASGPPRCCTVPPPLLCRGPAGTPPRCCPALVQ
ncbi:hypothetical protein PVAP13_9KG100940 [Panicum virgatum]|uniref:Uncharacterized protein n=1 Tax=Panicum virgatum TaxID=38727 RepID=A0A8T0NKP8_PANVG|nr:hypothetical protein PVAP13_9KG100940 [Panicum virgatum]